MEVHQHSHTDEHMSWKGYFFQFFMLFLAVFCGYMAEYFLEHRIEEEYGQEFIESFYNDLKNDTTRIAHFISYDEQKIKALSNLRDCYSAIEKSAADDSCLVNIMEHTAVNLRFERTERTLQQLTNAGGFRLLESEDADSISAYDHAFDRFRDFQQTIYQESQNNVRHTLNELASFHANAQMCEADPGELVSTQSFNRDNITEPILSSTDKALLNKYFNELLLYYRVICEHKTMLHQLRERQIKLIAYLSEKYHFE